MNTDHNYNAHEQLFSGAFSLNLRTFDERQLCVYTLTEYTQKSWLRKRQVKLMDMTSDTSLKPTCMLVLQSNDMEKAHYTGSHNDGMGHEVKYNVYIRTDVTHELQNKGVVAVAQVIRWQRLNMMFARWEYEEFDYFIYSSKWENDQRPKEPSF